MQQRDGVRVRVGRTLVLPLRIHVLAAATLVVAQFWSASYVAATDSEVPMASPPPAAGVEPGGGDAPGGAPMREDETNTGEERAPEAGDAGPQPFQGGCPYRGRSLELIV